MCPPFGIGSLALYKLLVLLVLGKPCALSKGSALELVLRSSFGLVGLDCTLKCLSEAGSE